MAQGGAAASPMFLATGLGMAGQIMQPLQGAPPPPPGTFAGGSQGYAQQAPPPAPPPAPAPAAPPAGTVACGNCQNQVRAEAKFCDSCGTPMARHCTNCNADLTAAAKFCAECGTPASPPAG